MPEQPTSRRSSRLLAVVCALLLLTQPAQASDFTGFGEAMLALGIIFLQIGLLVAMLVACMFGAFRGLTGFNVGLSISGAAMALNLYSVYAFLLQFGFEPMAITALPFGLVNMLIPCLQYGLAKRKRQRDAIEDYSPAERDDA